MRLAGCECVLGGTFHRALGKKKKGDFSNDQI